MGQVPVVSDRQFDGGEKLIRALARGGLPLTGACWAKTPDYGKTYLYLVAPEVQGADARPAFGKVREAIAALEAGKKWQHWLERIDPFDVMLVGPDEAVGKALAREYEQYTGDYPTIKPDWLGTIPVEGAAMIYPPSLFAQPAPAAG